MATTLCALVVCRPFALSFHPRPEVLHGQSSSLALVSIVADAQHPVFPGIRTAHSEDRPALSAICLFRDGFPSLLPSAVRTLQCGRLHPQRPQHRLEDSLMANQQEIDASSQFLAGVLTSVNQTGFFSRLYVEGYPLMPCRKFKGIVIVAFRWRSR